MLWKILGVIIGYVVMVAFIFMTFSAFYLAIGADMAYEPGSYQVSMLWIAVSTVLGFIAALIGGYVCKRLSGSSGTVKVFAGIVLILGIIIGIYQAVSPQPAQEARTAEVSNTEAMQKSQMPLWVAFMNPLIGAVGIVIGGGLGPGNKE
ncbi:MAG: hypothetical protein IPM63_13080 [Acidobacteriota bacterium]|nr:MAG: hypothetical protein IPM63_13080 [Acidobacteriota bacterium]